LPEITAKGEMLVLLAEKDLGAPFDRLVGNIILL
jgi:hypothetical protein